MSNRRKVENKVAMWSERLKSITNERLAVSEALAKERDALVAQIPEIKRQMEMLELELRKLYGEWQTLKFILSPSEQGRVHDALQAFRLKERERTNLSASHYHKLGEIEELIIPQSRPVLREIFDLLYDEYVRVCKPKAQGGEKIFQQVKEWRDIEGRHYHEVKDNWRAIAEAKKLLMGKMGGDGLRSRIQSMGRNSVDEILDVLDQGWNDFHKIDFSKCEQYEVSDSVYISATAPEETTKGFSSLLNPDSVKIEEAKEQARDPKGYAEKKSKELLEKAARLLEPGPGLVKTPNGLEPALNSGIKKTYSQK